MSENVDTICVQGGYQPGNGESRTPPIIQATTFKYKSSEQMIGVSKSIIAFVDEDFGGRIFVMFNPTITAKDGAYDASEGCLSLKGERRTVRFQRIEVSYADRKFRERHATFTGFTAQIIQHEIDHCEGIII